MTIDEIKRQLKLVIDFDNRDFLFVEDLPSFMIWDSQLAIDILNLIEKLEKENEELRTHRISKNRVKELIDFYKHKDFIMMMVVNGHDEESLKIVEVLKNLLKEDISLNENYDKDY